MLAITWLISGELECKPKCDWVPRPHLLLPQIQHQCTELLHLLQRGWDRSHRTGSTLQASIVYYKHVSLFLIFILFYFLTLQACLKISGAILDVFELESSAGLRNRKQSQEGSLHAVCMVQTKASDHILLFISSSKFPGHSKNFKSFPGPLLKPFIFSTQKSNLNRNEIDIIREILWYFNYPSL